eukprot:11596339-Alexandrium_andersonii.AAC.1
MGPSSRLFFCTCERRAASRIAARPSCEAAAETWPRAVPAAREGSGASHLSMEVPSVARAAEMEPRAESRGANGASQSPQVEL